MPATVCKLVVDSCSLEDGRHRAEGGGKRERRTGVEQLVPSTARSEVPRTIVHLSACAAMSGMPRPPGLHKLHSKSRSGRAMAANVLVKAGILVAEALEEGGHHLVLIPWPRKVVREAAPREGSRDLGSEVLRTADASDVRTCESVAVWCTVCKGEMKRHTYRLQGTRGGTGLLRPRPCSPLRRRRRRRTPRGR